MTRAFLPAMIIHVYNALQPVAITQNPERFLIDNHVGPHSPKLSV